MINNYLKIAFRNIKRNKVYSIINILGLAVGMTACLLIILLIHYELSFDHCHKNLDLIYQVFLETNSNGTLSYKGNLPGPLAPSLKEDFSGIIQVARITSAKLPFRKHNQKIMISYKEEFFMKKKFFLPIRQFLIYLQFLFYLEMLRQHWRNRTAWSLPRIWPINILGKKIRLEIQ